MWLRETSKPRAATWRGQACARELSSVGAACLPAAGAVERNATLRRNRSYRRGCFDASDHRIGQRVRSLWLPSDHDQTARSGLAGRQGSSAEDLAAGGTESAAETKAARQVVVQRWIVCETAARTGESRVELRFRESHAPRWRDTAAVGADR